MDRLRRIGASLDFTMSSLPRGAVEETGARAEGRVESRSMVVEGSSPQVVGRYAIYGKIASGGMATVHFGRLLGGAGFARTVAIKRLHPHLAQDKDFLATMLDEARLAARIHHPNVVPTLDVVASDGELLLVMEYVRGESLARLVRVEAERGRLVPLPVAASIMVGALHGLDAAHEATSDHGQPLGIVHRDISPQNILVGVDGLSRIIDFGVAKAVGRLQTTRDGLVKGKIAYMAPEQLAGQAVGRSADIYAMGVVMWELFTGRRLFEADDQVGVLAKVVAGTTEPPSRYNPAIPRQLDALVMRALARDPRFRFGAARDLAEELAQVVPPALPSYVGAWCIDAAGPSLAELGAALAEIESQSGRLPAAGASSGQGGSDMPGMGSQASNLAVAKSAVDAGIRLRSTAVILGAMVCGGALFALGSAVATSNAGRSSPAMEVTASPPIAAPPPAPSAAAHAPLPPATPWPVASTPVASAAPTAPAAAASAPEPMPASVPPAPAAAAPASPKGAPNCNPSYYLDANGNKHFKRECFHH
jgi:eukaryotic-like serine/threonine-protein kinase